MRSPRGQGRGGRVEGVSVGEGGGEGGIYAGKLRPSWEHAASPALNADCSGGQKLPSFICSETIHQCENDQMAARECSA